MERKGVERGSPLRRLLPLASWLPAYERRWLAGDIAGGLTAWALSMPLAMAFAAIAGVPYQYGLYAACLAPVGYALFGTSRHLNVGPAAAVAAVSAATVTPLAEAGTDRFLSLTVMLAFIVGAMLVAGGLARAGSLAKFLARPVLDGYVVGTAVFIAVGQLGKVFGVTAAGGNAFAIFADVLRQAGSWSWATFAVGAGCLVLLVLLRRLAPRFPAALAVVALAILAARLLGLDEHGVALVGGMPRGLSGLSFSGVAMGDIVALLPGAFALALFAFADSLALVRAYAARHRYRVDANQEMIALGAANLAAGALRGFAVDASYTRTAATEQAGGNTQLAAVICGSLTLLSVFLFTGLFERLPQASLAAAVIFAVGGLVEIEPFRRYRRAGGADYALALGALFGVLVFGVIMGIVIGVALSLVLFIQRASRPHTAVLGVDESGTRHGDLAERPECRPHSPHLVIYRFDAPLIFSNVDGFVEDVWDLVEKAATRPLAVVVDCEMIYEMDTTASDAFAGLHSGLSEEGVDVLLARVHDPVLSFMRRDGVVAMVGEENVFRTIRDAVQAFRLRYPACI